MMMIAFVCGLAIGAMVAYFAVSTPIVINTTVRAADPKAPTLACAKCGVTGGRNGPFKSVKALHGHARACLKK